MALDAAGRRLRARMAAHVSWSRTDSPSARTAPARAGLQARFEREVDPEGKLSAEDLKRRVESARRAYYLKLAYESAKARSRSSRFTVKQVAAAEVEKTLRAVDRREVGRLDPVEPEDQAA